MNKTYQTTNYTIKMLSKMWKEMIRCCAQAGKTVLAKYLGHFYVNKHVRKHKGQYRVKQKYSRSFTCIDK